VYYIAEGIGKICYW